MITVTIPEDVHAAVSSVARQLRSRYRDYCEFADIQQELYIWYLSHRQKVSAWEEEHDGDEKVIQRLLTRSLRNAGEKYCRAEKAQQCGYSVEDEYFYSIGQMADLLQVAFDPSWMAPAVDVTHDSAKRPPQEGGNLVAMVADVNRAFDSLPAWEQALLRRVYGGDLPVRDAVALEAASNDIGIKAQDMRIRRVLGRMRAALGGPRPWEDD